MSAESKKYVHALGRRKTSIAVVKLFEENGKSTINTKNIEAVYPLFSQKAKLNKPFEVAGLKKEEYMFAVKANGGGVNSQLEAISLGLARCLVKLFPETKKALKDAGLLTRDPRMVERKKTGLHKARKAEQYSKR